MAFFQCKFLVEVAISNIVNLLFIEENNYLAFARFIDRLRRFLWRKPDWVEKKSGFVRLMVGLRCMRR